MRLASTAKKAGLLALFLLATGHADDGMARLESVTSTRKGDQVIVDLATSRPRPEVSAYYLGGPDRVVVELNDTLPGTSLRGKPSHPLVKSWSLLQVGLNRSRLELDLACRPTNSEVKVDTDAHGVQVSFQPSLGQNDRMKLTEGITWVREDSYLGGRWVRLNRVLFDPKDPNVEVMVGLAKEATNAREPLTSMVARYDAVAGINGGFFSGKGGPLGLVYRDGKMVVPNVSKRPPRSGFGLTSSGKALFGRIAASGTKIEDLEGGDWTDAVLALGGGPRLVKEGLAKITADEEELGPKGNDITRVAARTVVGLAKDGQLMFATVAGYRDNHLEGCQFGPLVEWLKSLGIQEAVNFDGGASTDMVVGPNIVSDGPANRSRENPVATALLVRDKRARLYPAKAYWDVPNRVMWADGRSETEFSVRLSTPSGDPVPDGTKVNFYGDGVNVSPAAAETKAGVVVAKLLSVRHPGKASVELTSGPLTDKETFMLRASEPKKILVELGEPQASKTEGMQRVVAKVQLVDSWGNGVDRESFGCSVDGSDPADFTTDYSGVSNVELDLAAQGGVFKVSHPSAGTVTVQVPAMPAAPDPPAVPETKE